VLAYDHGDLDKSAPAWPPRSRTSARTPAADNSLMRQ
jgi:hypothetical protein